MSTALALSESPQASSTAFTRKPGVLGASSPVAKEPQRMSKHAVLPPITPPTSTGSPEDQNPFTMPPTNEVFTLRERERQKAKIDRAIDRKLKVHEKDTYNSRLNAKMASVRKEAVRPDSELSRVDKESGVHEDTQFVLASTKDRHIAKEDLVTFVGRKREMFLVQYSLGVKREEIRKLEEIAKTEEKKLVSAERYLEDSATMFDEFLKENDKNAVEAIKMAEAATKAKLEKVAEIKRLNAHLIATKNEISRNSELLTELSTYKTFLDRLVPPGSREPSAAARQPPPEVDGVPFHFTEPSQLIALFTELEEQNLSLIQNSQETEETLEEMRHTKKVMNKKTNKEIDSLQKQIRILKSGVEREEEKANDLETKAKLYSYGEYKAEDQEKMLEQLGTKVSDVYTKCIGANDANIPTLQMLAAIEGRLEELFETIENLPSDRVDAAEKAKEKERRMRQREEKLEEQRLAQEERLRRAQERAQADPKKRVGRKLVYRSEPPILKKKQRDKDEKKELEEEEMKYFFS